MELATPGSAVRQVSAVRNVTKCATRPTKGALWDQCNQYGRPPDKSVYLKIDFLISQSKHMLWVLK